MRRAIAALAVAGLVAACGSSSHTTTVPPKVRDAQIIACWNHRLRPFTVAYTKRLLQPGQTIAENGKLPKDDAAIVANNAVRHSAGHLPANLKIPGIEPTLAAALKACGKIPAGSHAR